MPRIPTSITAHFAGLPDPRVERTKRHQLLDILTIALCAVLCGADDFVGMATFAGAKEGWLRTFLPLPGGIPCHDTFGRVFAALDPEAFQACFLAWARAVVPSTAGQVVALDGKALRGAQARSRGQAALHMVSDWASESRLVLGQVAVEERSNEITAIPALLRVLDLAGATVTIDAMRCQTAIAAQIVAQGADYVLALKKNHPTLHEEVAFTFAQERQEAFASTPAGTYDYLRTVEKDHGRLEIRQHWTLRDPAVLAHLDPAGAWARLQAIGLVVRQRRLGAHLTTEEHYYLLSAPLSAQDFARAVRSHWGIENRVHWVLDVAFREDACRARAGHAARNFAVVRHLALNLLRQDRTRKGSIATKRFTAALDDTYLAALLEGLATQHAPGGD
jgi:predicted transposase YbfD/YdcC